MKKEYALYSGEEIVAMGSFQEIAKETGLAIGTLYYYNSPTYRKRIEKAEAKGRDINILVEIMLKKEELYA